MSLINGKALEAYNRLTVEELADYQAFKTAILRAYGLRQDTYRLKFLNAKKRPGETHEQYAQYCSDTLDKWLHSKQVTADEEMRDLILLEQFTNGVDRESSEWIREKRRKVVKESALWADDHVLSKRGGYSKGGTLSHSVVVDRWKGRKQGFRKPR